MKRSWPHIVLGALALPFLALYAVGWAFAWAVREGWKRLRPYLPEHLGLPEWGWFSWFLVILTGILFAMLWSIQ